VTVEKKRPRIRLSWVFAVIVTAMLAVMLVIAGLANSGIVNDALGHDPTSAATVPVRSSTVARSSTSHGRR